MLRLKEKEDEMQEQYRQYLEWMEEARVIELTSKNLEVCWGQACAQCGGHSTRGGGGPRVDG